MIPEANRTPIDVRHLFSPLDEQLMQLLASLTPEEWELKTIARHWTVKDVVSHLLDGNLRVLSIQRDRYFGEVPPAENSYEGLVHWLNWLNADWVNATKRISPSVLLMLHQATGPGVSRYYESLDLHAEAVFAVDWAGENKSYNWMHLAREYTEKWLHQQQIRDAVNKEGILTKAFFYPFINTFMLGLPHTFRNTDAPHDTHIKVVISGVGGGSWYLARMEERWRLVECTEQQADAIVEIPARLSWKLFSKSLSPEAVYEQVKIVGDERLGRKVLEMVSVMA